MFHARISLELKPQHASHHCALRFVFSLRILLSVIVFSVSVPSRMNDGLPDRCTVCTVTDAHSLICLTWKQKMCCTQLDSSMHNEETMESQ